MKQFANKGKRPSQGNKPTQSKKSSQGTVKIGNSKQVIDWDSYITKEAGIDKGSSSKNANTKNKPTKNAFNKSITNKNSATKNASKSIVKAKSQSVGVKKAEKSNKIIHPTMMHLFYMATAECTCKQIVASVEEEKGMEIQVWPDLGIASIEFGEASSVDFQECEMESFDSDSDKEFLEEQKVKAIYEVTVAQEDKARVAKWFLSMIQANGGFFCTDSDDFAPIYSKEELEKWI
ncbi:hypothetical protein [Anaerosporobacter sp.]|uniref:hypothetical protein n=1 Tax=Anaerosporobacter sp. TaxID=1872529 RepID=UPI00286F87D9|nr:hypothetical protein [Anaerosporobacter sp.]